MKKNHERILKYLSELMDEKERIEFEQELSSSPELADDLSSVRGKIDAVVPPEIMDVDERYFASLVPRVHSGIEKKKKNIFRKSAYYLASTAAAAIVIFLFLLNSKEEFETQYKDLAEKVVNNFSDREVSEKYFTELESNPADFAVASETDGFNVQIPSEVEVNSESYSRLIDNPVSEDYRTLHSLSEKELEVVFEKLNSEYPQKVIK